MNSEIFVWDVLFHLWVDFPWNAGSSLSHNPIGVFLIYGHFLTFNFTVTITIAFYLKENVFH
jgi:hypothetical protein